MVRKRRILFLDDEDGMCRMAKAVLTDAGFEVDTSSRPEEAMKSYRPGTYDVVVTDVKMPRMNGMEVLESVRALAPAPPVIMVTAFATVEMSIQALRKGAYDMLTKPFEPEELLHRIRNALRQDQLAEENRELKEELAGRDRFAAIVGESPALMGVLDLARKVAQRELPVLITGESGTGKELVAQAIHRHSPRRDRNFVAINCGALPNTLLESELFGSRKGAFTGADEERIGLVQAADGGTLFLDEVGTLPLNVQKVLLRFLQEKEFYRVGESVPSRVDVRVVAATNADLEAAVRDGTFREDLYYRLAVVRIAMPPLRERRSDVPLLAVHFLKEQVERFGAQAVGFEGEAMEALIAFDWPGNVRQLRNVIEASAAVETGERIRLETLQRFLSLAGGGDLPPAGGDYAASLGRFESEYFRDLLDRCDGNAEEAALRAGVNVATLYRKIKKYNLRTKK